MTQAVLAFGRMNPPTTGHEKFIKKAHEVAKKVGGKAHVVASHSEGNSKNPIPQKKKLEYIKKIAHPDVHVSGSSKRHPTILHHAAKLHAAGHTHLHVVAAGDKESTFHKLLHKYNGKKGPHGHYNFKSITVHSSGKRDPDSDDHSEGVSGTNMRQHARDNNHKEFKKGLPKALHPHKDEMMNHINSIKEEIELEETVWKTPHHTDEHDEVHTQAGTPSGTFPNHVHKMLNHLKDKDNYHTAMKAGTTTRVSPMHARKLGNTDAGNPKGTRGLESEKVKRVGSLGKTQTKPIALKDKHTGHMHLLAGNTRLTHSASKGDTTHVHTIHYDSSKMNEEQEISTGRPVDFRKKQEAERRRKMKQQGLKVVINKRPTNEDLDQSFEDLVEALNVVQRIKRKLIMRRIRPKINRAKRLFKHRKVPAKNLQQRARKAGIRFVRKRVAGKKGTQYTKLSAAAKMHIDKKVSKQQKIVTNIARRLLPRTRKAELVRLQRNELEQDFADYLKERTNATARQDGKPFEREDSPTVAAKTKHKYKDKNEKSVRASSVTEQDLHSLYLKSIKDGKSSEREDNPTIAAKTKHSAAPVTEQDLQSLYLKSIKGEYLFETILEVFVRGIEDWDGGNKSPAQHAFNRVNSFVAGGKAYELDYDLVEEQRLAKENFSMATGSPGYAQSKTSPPPRVKGKKKKVLEWGTDEATAHAKNMTPGEVTEDLQGIKKKIGSMFTKNSPVAAADRVIAKRDKIMGKPEKKEDPRTRYLGRNLILRKKVEEKLGFDTHTDVVAMTKAASEKPKRKPKREDPLPTFAQLSRIGPDWRQSKNEHVHEAVGPADWVTSRHVADTGISTRKYKSGKYTKSGSFGTKLYSKSGQQLSHSTPRIAGVKVTTTPDSKMGPGDRGISKTTNFQGNVDGTNLNLTAKDGVMQSAKVSSKDVAISTNRAKRTASVQVGQQKVTHSTKSSGDRAADRKSVMNAINKSFKKQVASGSPIPMESVKEGLDYKMTYHKHHTSGDGADKKLHKTVTHTSVKFDEKPTTPERVQHVVQNSDVHKNMKKKGYDIHTYGSHKKDHGAFERNHGTKVAYEAVDPRKIPKWNAPDSGREGMSRKKLVKSMIQIEKDRDNRKHDFMMDRARLRDAHKKNSEE